jgi:hypothetical protein
MMKSLKSMTLTIMLSSIFAGGFFCSSPAVAQQARSTKNDNIPSIHMLRIVKDQGRSIDWMLAVEDFDHKYDPEQGDVLYDGKSYLKVGIPENMRNKQQRWLEGKDGALGIVYSDRGTDFHKIDSIYVKAMDGPKKGFEDLLNIEIKVNENFYSHCLYYGMDQDPVTKKFPWVKLGNVADTVYFNADDEIPQNYQPLYSLRVMDLTNYESVQDVSPRLNAVGLGKLAAIQEKYMWVRGIQWSGEGLQTLEALNIKEKSKVGATQKAIIIYKGDGTYDLVPMDTQHKGTIVDAIYINGQPVLTVEPLTRLNWNFRKENFFPHTMF